MERIEDGQSVMPQARIQGRIRGGRRRIAIAAGIILLFAQLAGAAHVHQWFAGPRLTKAAAATIDDGLCALCLFHFHSPSAASQTQNLTAPIATHGFIALTTLAIVVESPRSRLHVRAPPASL